MITGVELDELLELLDRAAAPDLGARVARRAAPALERVARAQWLSGQAPDGNAWPATKGGGVALLPLTARIRVSTEGGNVVMIGPEELGYHARTRPVFPAPGDIAEPWLEALDEAALEELEGSR